MRQSLAPVRRHGRLTLRRHEELTPLSVGQEVGIEASPSFVRQPEGNGVAERFIRTLKEQLLWVRTFHTLEELQDALRAFRIWYNANWLIQRHRHRIPDQVRADQQDEDIADSSLPMAA